MTSTSTVEEQAGADRRARPWGVVVVVALVAAAAVGWAAGVRAGTADEPTAADVGFLQDMRVHHEQAVELSLPILDADPDEPRPDPAVRHIARDVVLAQQLEIGQMDGLLRAWGGPTTPPDDRVMGWMGHAVGFSEMPGVAAPEDVDRLYELAGDARDLHFARLMAVHHAGGVAMAEAALDRARSEEVRRLARSMAAGQRKEIGELRAITARLGSPADLAALDEEIAAAGGGAIGAPGERGSATHGDHG